MHQRNRSCEKIKSTLGHSTYTDIWWCGFLMYMYLHIHLSVNLCFWEEKQKNAGLVALLAVRGICLRTHGYEWVVCDSICMCVSVSQCVRNSISDRVLTAVKIHAFLLLLLVDPKDPPLPPNNTSTPSDMVFTDHMRLSVMYSPRN